MVFYILWHGLRKTYKELLLISFWGYSPVLQAIPHFPIYCGLAYGNAYISTNLTVMRMNSFLWRCILVFRAFINEMS